MLLPGTLIDQRYFLERALPGAGLSEVVLARDRRLGGRSVVLKALKVDSAAQPNAEYLRKKFEQEIEALARINHPGVVKPSDAGTLPDGRTYLVMEYIPGVSLRSAIRPGGMELIQVAAIIQQLGMALAEAHKKGVVHGDLKPENIMLQRVGEQEHVKLIDFGVATILDSFAAESGPATGEAAIVAGTLAYMAPEQILGQISAGVDGYALAVIAYEMLSGRRPFPATSVRERLEAQRGGIPVSLHQLRPVLPPGVDAIIGRGLAPAPEDRDVSVGDFTERLARALKSVSAKVAQTEPLVEAVEILALRVYDPAGSTTARQAEFSRNLQITIDECLKTSKLATRIRRLDLPAGGGLVLIFPGGRTAALEFASEIARSLLRRDAITGQMGIHRAMIRPDDGATVESAFVRVAVGLMRCGEPGHILVSEAAAEANRNAPFASNLHDLGPHEIPEAGSIRVFNFWTSQAGNQKCPKELARGHSAVWVICHAACLAFALFCDLIVSYRFLASGASFAGISIAVLLNVFWVAIASISISATRHWLEKRMAQLDLNVKFTFRRQMIAGVLSLALAVGLWSVLPIASRLYNNRAYRFQQLGALDEAIQMYRLAGGLDPGNAAARYNLGVAYEQAFDNERAIAAYLGSLRADPDFHIARNNLARLYILYRKDCAQALNILEPAITTPPETSIQYALLKNVGWAHFCMGLNELAESELKKAIELQRQGAAAHCLMAYVLEAQQRQALACPEWGYCLAYSPGQDGVEAIWTSVATARLGKECRAR